MTIRLWDQGVPVSDALIRMMNKDFQGKAHTGTQDKSRLISTMALYMAHGKDVYKVE